MSNHAILTSMLFLSGNFLARKQSLGIEESVGCCFLPVAHPLPVPNLQGKSEMREAVDLGGESSAFLALWVWTLLNVLRPEGTSCSRLYGKLGRIKQNQGLPCASLSTSFCRRPPPICSPNSLGTISGHVKGLGKQNSRN